MQFDGNVSWLLCMKLSLGKERYLMMTTDYNLKEYTYLLSLLHDVLLQINEFLIELSYISISISFFSLLFRVIHV